MNDPIHGAVSDLLARQIAAVEQHLRGFLAARGVDPDDRTPGWEDRARIALADVELHESVDWSDDYQATITTTIRPRTRIRQVFVGETFDLAPHEKANVMSGGGILITIDGGPGGIKGARIG